MKTRTPGEQVCLKNPTAGEIVSTLPDGNDVNALLGQFLTYMGNDHVDPLVRMAAGHAAFEIVHPFMDGNGRTDRVLNCAILCRSGMLTEPILYMSGYLIENRREYYRQLRLLSEGRGIWDRWMVLMLDCVRESSVSARSMISDISALYDLSRLPREAVLLEGDD